MHTHVSILMHRCENIGTQTHIYTHMTTHVARSGILSSNQGKGLDRAGMLCLELEGLGRWAGTGTLFLVGSRPGHDVGTAALGSRSQGSVSTLKPSPSDKNPPGYLCLRGRPKQNCGQVSSADD